MRVVVDANIVIAALLRPTGWTAGQWKRADIEFLVPEAIDAALAKHEAALVERAQCTAREWRSRVAALRRGVSVIPSEVARRYLDSAMVKQVRAADPEDAVYAATLLATKADLLWTRDEALLRILAGRATSVLPWRARP